MSSMLTALLLVLFLGTRWSRYQAMLLQLAASLTLRNAVAPVQSMGVWRCATVHGDLFAQTCVHINSTEKRHWLQPQHQQHWKMPLTATMTSTALKNATDCNHDINSNEKCHWLQPQHQQKMPLTATTTSTALKNATDCNHNTHHFSNSSQGDALQLAACQTPTSDLHYGGEAAELNTAANCCSHEKLGHYSLLWTLRIMFSAVSAGAGNWSDSCGSFGQR